MNCSYALTPYAKYKAVVPLFSVTLLLLTCCGWADHNVSTPPAVAFYAGAPQFDQVNRAPDVFYAANSPDEVLHAGNAYYLRSQKWWFTSADPAGPWQRARTVPREFKDVACTSVGHKSPFGGEGQLCVGPLPKVRLSRGPY